MHAKRRPRFQKHHGPGLVGLEQSFPSDVSPAEKTEVQSTSRVMNGSRQVSKARRSLAVARDNPGLLESERDFLIVDLLDLRILLRAGKEGTDTIKKKGRGRRIDSVYSGT